MENFDVKSFALTASAYEQFTRDPKLNTQTFNSSPYNGTLTSTGIGTIPYQNNIYDYGSAYQWVQWYPYTQRIEVEPTKCMGKAHVFECDHVTACQCGKVQRVMPKPKKEKSR